MMISCGWRRMGAPPCCSTRRPGGARARRAPPSRGSWPARRPRGGPSSCPRASLPTMSRSRCARSGPYAVDVASGVEASPGKQGRGQGAALRRGRPRRGSGNAMTPRPPRSRAIAGRQRPLRPLRGPLRPRDADEPAHRARAGLPRGVARRALSPPPRRAPVELCRPADAAVLRRAADASRGRRPHLPEARGPVPHRRAQDQQRARARRCSPCAWARSASSPRRERASTASPPPPPRRCSASNARCTWARSTWSARRSTSSA